MIFQKNLILYIFYINLIIKYINILFRNYTQILPLINLVNINNCLIFVGEHGNSTNN